MNILKYFESTDPDNFYEVSGQDETFTTIANDKNINEYDLLFYNINIYNDIGINIIILKGTKIYLP